ncbi:MAG: ribonuclease Y [Dehalococcoidia bacterium]|nr:ribonuclease Y [Dehalococcoidia bacterium]
MPNELAALAIFSALIIGLICGGIAVLMSRGFYANRQIRAGQKRAARIIAEARNDAKGVIADARVEIDKSRTASENEARERRAELQRQENRLTQKEANMDHKLEEVDARHRQIDSREKELEVTREGLNELKAKRLRELEAVASLSCEDAKNILLEQMEGEMRTESSRRLHEWEQKLKEEADEKARDILTLVIQRSASEVVAETTVSTVSLPNDEMKGRLIGREGRNIRALEQATGVDLIIDDTPEAVTLSSFDPVRREVARLALSKLILDGRIHPSRIEELVAKTREEVEAAMVVAGEQAAFQAGVHGLHPELIKLLGRLKFRTSYSQNVLAHSMEVARISGMIASELGANVITAKKAGLLHDIGKAVDREVEGTHASIGADLVKQWDKNKDVVRGVAEHHFDVSEISLWGFLVSAADAISSARPGARRESMENYLQRLKSLEEIADGFSGVEKSYAIQAGREVRILVKPEEVDDLSSMRLARDIVKKIEESLTYPGQIKVTVIRETRATDFAK